MRNKQLKGNNPNSICSHMRYLIQDDKIYKDQSIAHAALARLNQLNANQFQIFHQEPEHSQEQHALKNSPNIEYISNFSVDSYFNFSQTPSILPINSDEFVRSYIEGAEESQRTVSQIFRLDCSEIDSSIQRDENFQMQKIEIEHPSKEKSEDPLKSQGKQRESFPQSPSSSLTSREEKAYNKNLVCYIAKTVRRMMFGKFSATVAKRCQKEGISYQHFVDFCDQRKFNGVNALVSLFKENDDPQEAKMRTFFKHLFQKILKRAYLRTAIEEGKMTKLDVYTDFKNKYLLHLDQAQKE